MDVLEAIKGRRSVRRYRPDPVSDQDLETVLEAARWAPSWANTQCWRFIVVRDPQVKASLAEVMPSQRNTDIIKSAPMMIVACAVLGKAGYRRGEPLTDKGDWFMFDTALAMQNLVLAAYSLGLGTVHIGRFDAQKVSSILGVPDDMAVVEMTPLGYPDETPKGPPRLELKDMVYQNRCNQG